MTRERIIGVIQARLESGRLPGKVLATVGGIPLVSWTVQAMQAVSALDGLVLATTTEPADDQLEALLAPTLPVHRGPTYDVLARCFDALEPYRPTIVVRETADNPFVDPSVVDAQIRRLVEGGLDFVGNDGWPLGIAAEVATWSAFAAAAAEARDPAEREHVMPFLYARPDRFAIGSLPAPAVLVHRRYTVDTQEDLELARALASQLKHGPPVHLPELEVLMAAHPHLKAINAEVRQKPWHETDPRRVESTADRQR